jgi:hypothetical protein
MRQLLFALGALTVVALVAPRSAGAGFFVSNYSRVGVIAGAPCGGPVLPAYAPPYYYPPYYYPYYNAPVVVYSTPLYPRPYYGFQYRDDDYGRRVVGYTFPGRR